MSYIALLLCTIEGKFNSERPGYDTLVYFFACFQFDPACLLCENLFLNSKVADKNSKVIYLAVCQGEWSELEWHVGECIHIVTVIKHHSWWLTESFSLQCTHN